MVKIPRGRGPKVPRPPPASSPAATAVMKANRPRDTSLELTVRRALWARGVRGYRIAPRGIPGRPDVTFRRDRLAVFINGCFWHQHGCSASTSRIPKSNRSYWSLKFSLNKIQDSKKEEALRALGWKVVTLWECEIRSSVDACAETVKRALTSSR